MSLPDPRSLRGPGSLAAPWPSGFRPAKSERTLNKRSAQEASRGRRGLSQQDSIPPRELALQLLDLKLQMCDQGRGARRLVTRSAYFGSQRLHPAATKDREHDQLVPVHDHRE
jgi:hypothetical protein